MSETFLAAIRKACPSGLWSRGVTWAREGAVTLVEASGDEVTLRVKERGRAVSPTVILYVRDEEWDCDCESKVSPCAHVAAATIAWVQGTAAREAGGSTASGAQSGPSAELRYMLHIEHGALGISRAFVVEGNSRPLEISLADRIARGIVEPRYEPTHDDMTIDRLFMRRLKGDVPLELMSSVLEALSRSRDVRLGDEPIRTSGEPVLPDARVEDAPRGGVKLVVVPPADCSVLAMCVARVAGVLRPLAETARFGLRFEKLPVERVFGPPELGTLAAEILPELERSMVVAVATKRLPRRARRLPPRIEFELSHEHGALFVLPLLVYGDPACARIDAGKLVLLSPPAPVREEAKERELMAHLRDELALVPGRRVRFDGREAAKFAHRLEQFHMRDESARSFGEPTAVRELVPRIVADGQKLDIVFELPTGEDERDSPRIARAADVASAWNEGLGIVALEGGGFARLPEKFFAEHGQAILDLVASKGDDEEMPKTAWPVVLEVADSLGVSLPAIRDAIAPIARDFEGIPEVELPATVASLLRPYQRDGAKWLAFLRDASLGGLLSDDMGLGKTVQLLSILKGPAIVVCPKSVVYNWASEIARFRPDLKVARYEGPNREIDPSADITLTTYAVLRIDIEDLSKVEWSMAVLDEAQAIKNPDSQASRAAFRLQAKARFCLTGTPVENRLDDLWSLLRFSNPGLLGTRADFLERYAGPMMDGSPAVAERLRKRIKPFVLRRTKKEVLTDLPPRTDAVQYCELSDEERNSYQAVLAATRKEVVEKLAEGANVLLMLEALLRLRQAACHSGLLPGNEASTSSKVERLVASLEELVAEGHKALVFSQWTSLLDRVEPHLNEANLGFVRLDGATRDREAVVRAFQAAEGPPVMLLSLKAGGVGLNLTRADHVFLLDPWWNPAVEDQAADRAHRIGQDRPVMVYRLVAKDTVEERILVLQEKKRKLAEAAIGEGASQAAAITREDLLELLNG